MEYNVKDGLCYLGNENNPYLYLAGVESSSITEASIDSNCRFIGDYAFSFCTQLTDVAFGDDSKLIHIGNNAFFYCGALSSITIPAGVTTIDSPFYACTSLTSIIFKDTTTWYVTDSRTDFENKTGGTSTDVTDSSANATYFSDTYSGCYWYNPTPEEKSR